MEHLVRVLPDQLRGWSEQKCLGLGIDSEDAAAVIRQVRGFAEGTHCRPHRVQRMTADRSRDLLARHVPTFVTTGLHAAADAASPPRNPKKAG
jgi:hypothetical protein